MGEEFKKDCVNRVTGEITLEMDGSGLKPGQTVVLTHVEEKDINVCCKDARKMEDPAFGNATGDAVFDARIICALEGDSPTSVLAGTDDMSALGYMESAEYKFDARKL